MTKGNGLFPQITKPNRRLLLLKQGQNLLAYAISWSPVLDAWFVYPQNKALEYLVVNMAMQETEEEAIGQLYEVATIHLESGLPLQSRTNFNRPPFDWANGER